MKVDATMSVETTELAVIENAAPVAGLASELANLSRGTVSGYSSIQGNSFEDRVTLINAISAATPVADELGKPFLLKDVVIESVTLANERTGELQEVPRITFIDDKGRALAATSDVLFKDIKRTFAILGTPNNWPAPVPVVINKEKAKVGSFFTLQVLHTLPTAK
jgi:hypothetical protein